MIAASSSGQSFGALGTYLVGDDGRVGWAETRNMMEGMDGGRIDPDAVAAEMRDEAAASGVAKPVYHIAIAFDPDDHPTEAEVRAAADRTLRDLGLEDHQALVVRHTDQPHAHVHLMVNRVGPDGKAWSTWRDRYRLRASMEAETHLFVAKTIFEGEGTLQALLTDNHGYLSDITEPLYPDAAPLSGETVPWTYTYIAASGAVTQTLQLRPVTHPRGQRSGLLTLPSVLALGAHPVHPSAILRGKRILERVACTELGTPPPGAEGERPPDTAEAESTNRVRTEAVTAEQPCAGCHDVINPAGFAFENYDAVGGYRTEDNGQRVDASGVLELGDERLRFDDGIDLSQQLSTLPLVQDCYAQRWTNYALGTPIDPTDPDMERLLRDFRKDDDVLGLLTAIATSEFFRFRALGGE